MRKNQYYENLIETVLELSESEVWDSAVLEWEIYDCEEDGSFSNSCVCGKDRLLYLYTIRNVHNGNLLYPIGSSCIKKFKREDLNFEVEAYQDMFILLHAVEKGEYITLTSDYFSRKLLLYLFKNGAFKPNKYNGYDEENAYAFMLDMFRKRNKDEISGVSRKKINAIIVNDIIPFVNEKIKIRNPIWQPKLNSYRKCPICGGNLIKRTATRGSYAGKKFWGCSNYPKCTHKENIDKQ